MVPGKDIDIKVDHVYGREEALRVIEASMQDYEADYGHLHRAGEE
jgi:inorganic pyrophosphatase